MLASGPGGREGTGRTAGISQQTWGMSRSEGRRPSPAIPTSCQSAFVGPLGAAAQEPQSLATGQRPTAASSRNLSGVGRPPSAPLWQRTTFPRAPFAESPPPLQLHEQALEWAAAPKDKGATSSTMQGTVSRCHGQTSYGSLLTVNRHQNIPEEMRSVGCDSSRASSLGGTKGGGGRWGSFLSKSDLNDEIPCAAAIDASEIDGPSYVTAL